MDEKMIRHVAELSKIELTPEETAEMAQDMERLLKYVDMLRQEAGESAAVRDEPITVDDLRADIVQPSMDRGVALDIAPDASDQGFLVPPIIE